MSYQPPYTITPKITHLVAQISEAIGGYSDLNAAIKSFKAGESTEIVVYRGGEYVTLRITFDEAKPDAGTNGVSEFGISCIPN